jgi:dihydroorotate dehydrogenase electron transfer subunit
MNTIASRKPNKAIYSSPILAIENEATDIFRLRLLNPEIATHAKPGQFINIRVREEIVPLLRRPFSICQVNRDEGWIEILFGVVGKGTELLSLTTAGDNLDILGPLGRSFEIPSDLELGLLIAGGLGLAPLLFLCQEIAAQKIQTIFFYGAKTQKECCSLEEFTPSFTQTHIATDDGSFGQKGLVTDSLEDFLESSKKINSNLELFSCGPAPMLKKVQELARKYQLECQLSLETIMACGMGICMGCAVEVNSKKDDRKYHLVCKDGPVFKAEEVVLND